MKTTKYLGYLSSLEVNKSSAGFTLLELVIVCAIIGILAAIALPNYDSYTSRARVSESLQMTSEVRHAIAKYYFYTGRFPTDNYTLGLAEPDKIRGKYIQSTTVENGAIHVLFSDKNADLSGKYISFRPVIVKGEPTAPIHFNCGYAKITSESQKIIGKNQTNLNDVLMPAVCGKKS